MQCFNRLQSHSYHIRLAKCTFMADEVKFLGHKLSARGIETLSSRQKDLDAFQPPFETPRKVRSFLGLVHVV